MFTFHVTSKVSSRLKQPLEQIPSHATNLLGAWYVNLLIVHRQHILLLVSERTLLPVLMPAKNLALFPKKFPAVLGEMLEAIALPPEKILAELQEMTEWRFAKTASRQILGSMNDFAKILDVYIEDGAPLQQQALRLARYPCSPIGMDNPINATAAVFGEKLSVNLFDF
jgi:hypothetical protein